MTISPDRPDAYAALRVPSFLGFQSGSFLLQMGTSAQSLALGWEIYDRTSDPLLLGLVGGVQAIPMLTLTLPAGYLADVLDRKRLIMASLCAASAASLGLAVAMHLHASLWLIYLLLFLDACAIRVAWPARQAILPSLVPPGVFPNAVMWRTSTTQVSGMLGPTVGGFIVGWWTPAAFVFCSLGALFFMLVLASLSLPSAPRTPKGNMIRQVLEGAGFVWSRKILLGALSLDTFAVLLGGATFLLPVFARDVIDLSSTGMSPEQALGWLRAAPAAGALVAAMAVAHLPPMRYAGRAMLLSVAGFGVATIVFGISESFWLSLAMLALTGFFDNVSVVVRHTLIQLATPDSMRGRVSSVNAIFIGSSNDLGGLESGLVAQFLGPVVSVVSGGVGTLLIVAAWARLFPALRELRGLTSIRVDEPSSEGRGPDSPRESLPREDRARPAR